MANPTITYAGTVVTLPMPLNSTPHDQAFTESARELTTLGGNLRRVVFNAKFVYDLQFTFCALTVYRALVALWRAAEAGGSFPTFDFSTAWPEAVSVPVSLAIGKAVATHDLALVNFTLTVTEVGPR